MLAVPRSLNKPKYTEPFQEWNKWKIGRGRNVYVCMHKCLSVCMYVCISEIEKKKEAKTEEFESPRIRTEEFSEVRTDF